MKMSTKGRYAVMAMIDIATHSDGEPVSLAEIAERQDISQEYLEQLFGKLRKAKLVESARGPGGGYRLACDKSMIPVAKIIAAVAHDLWSSLGRQMMAFLSSITLEDVVEKRNLALAATIKQIKDRHPEGMPA